jgi:hypothetical protein
LGVCLLGSSSCCCHRFADAKARCINQFENADG